MRKTVLIILLMAFSLVFSKDYFDSLFRKGNASYNSGDYESAIKFYSEIVDSGYVNGEVYYNLGNAYYKSGDIVYAIVSYERAKKYMHGDDDLIQNLKVANLSVVDRVEVLDENPMQKFFNSTIYFKNIYDTKEDLVKYLLLASILLSLTLFIRIKKVRILGITLTFLIVAIVLFKGYSLVKLSEDFQRKEGVVLHDKITVMSAPDENVNSTVLFNLHKGTKIGILKNSGEWFEIFLGKDKVGWVKKSEIIVI